MPPHFEARALLLARARNRGGEPMTSGRRCQSPLFAALGATSLLLLAACTPLPDWRAIAQQSMQIHAACESQHPDSALATEQCANGQISNLYTSAGFPDM